MENSSKKNPLKTALTIAVSLAFAALFLWLALRGLDFFQIKSAVLKVDYFWVFASMIFGVAAYWFRAARWNLLLRPLGYPISVKSAFWSIAFGYLMNLTIPRSGEVARATALFGVEKVPVDRSFGTIILERVIDFVCMLIFLGLTLVFKHDAIFAFYQQSGIHINPVVIFAGFFFCVLGSILFFRFKKYFVKYRLIGKIINFVEGIFHGLGSIFKLKEKGKFILYTVAIWVSYFFAAYLICFALPETKDFTIADGFFILVVGTFGMMVPASGGIGAFNLAMKLGFAALFLAAGKNAETGGEIGIIYSFISLPLQIFITLVLGLISIPMLAKLRNNNLKD